MHTSSMLPRSDRRSGAPWPFSAQKRSVPSARRSVVIGPDPPTGMRARLKSAFERFIDVRHLRDDEIAKLLRELEIDIAVDLKGFTDDARTGIFAFRPAPKVHSPNTQGK